MQLHHYKAISRLASCSSVLPKILKKYLSVVNAPRIVASKAFDAADETMGKDKIQFLLKTAKGTKDCVFSPIKFFECKIAYANIISGDGKDMVIRDRIFSTITSVFKRHGAVTIDTPVFELKEILSGKYGEDSKLIYDLADQGGELCSLRYDLTVPFARWLAMHPSIQSIKRYHLAKVYRRDQPAMTKGRLREFYQCDFDIAGTYDPMLPDAEILRILFEVFQELGWEGRYSIQINHRGILDGIFEVCGVPKEKIRTISSAVDKLDKASWDEVRKEMTEEKGLDGDIADRIWDYVQKKGGRDVLQQLRDDEKLAENKSMQKGLDDMDLLFNYLEAFNVLDKTEFNLSLARGLDYYTGLIFEVITEGSAPPTKSENPNNNSRPPRPSKKEKIAYNFDEDRSNDPSVGVGSVAAGGRYDELVGIFSGKSQIPCVGLSLGVDRIVSITKARMESDKAAAAALRSSEVDVFVMAFGGKGFTGLLKDRLEVCKILWDAGIKAEFAYKQKPKLPAQFKSAETNEVPFAVILGEEEQAKGQVRIKELGLEAGHAEKDGVLVCLTDLVEEVKQRLRGKEEKLIRGNVEVPKTVDDGSVIGKNNAVEAVTKISDETKTET